jgi:hypothetical protein
MNPSLNCSGGSSLRIFKSVTYETFRGNCPLRTFRAVTYLSTSRMGLGRDNSLNVAMTLLLRAINSSK